MGISLSMNSKIKDVYANPVGHDILRKLLLQYGKSEKLLNNPLVGNLSLKAAKRLSGKILDQDFFNSFLRLLNQEKEVPLNDNAGVSHSWWKETVFYQIYPRSFMDGNYDGIGDLKGILTKLDYLKDLGVGALWLSPIYDSPNDDNGYDIRNYYEIMEEFGTMEDFDTLLNEVHSRGMKLIMDLVVNHTSDEHPWFQDALQDPDSSFDDFYIFKKSADDQPPNNWTSFFGGSAWSYYGEKEEWALHLFSKKQMDLNWDSKPLRKAVSNMVQWWLKKGVDGFRMDVINYISKEPGLPSGNQIIGNLLGYYGIEHYFYGPELHEYLRELREDAFEPFHAFSVGETPGVGMEMSKLLTGDYRKELDMVFSFDMLENPGHLRFDEYDYDLNYMKHYLTEWMENYGDNYWMALFFDNHDNPRMLSKINKDPAFRDVLSKLLAVIQMTLKGTPFLFQGQEYGAINKAFSCIEDLRDVESQNYYKDYLKTMSEDEAFKKILVGTRDHTRTCMQWNGSENAGFSSHTPWIPNDGDFLNYNVEKQLSEQDSILNFYKSLISLRKTTPALIYGNVIFAYKHVRNLFTWYRRYQNKTWFIECCMCSGNLKRPYSTDGYTCILSNYKEPSDLLRPYEANIYMHTSHQHRK